jgi:lipoprotein signal peptidase
VRQRRQTLFMLLGLSLATFNLFLADYFRGIEAQLSSVALDTPNWFFIAKPVYNWGGFFVDGSAPTLHRLPTVVFLIWLSILLTGYLKTQRSFIQSASAAILLGGIGGLTLDILSFGSVCDWLGFHVPKAPIFSQLNLSDLMILLAAPVAAIVCPQKIWLRFICFALAFLVIAANSYYHVVALSDWVTGLY